MATLLLTAVGTVLGGPLGGAIGAVVGQQIDTALIGRGSAKGPRLKDLTLQTSSYGSTIPLHFGRIRSAGSVIWSTELIEQSNTQGGGKSQPSVTTYSYSASFAVALCSRPIAGLGRIWADGNLLRGAGGDLKVQGSLRVYNGYGDQPVDPLIAQHEGVAQCPAFRNIAYVVFEDLALADFGNRLPSLTFEIFADERDTSVAHIIGQIAPDVSCSGLAKPMAGFTIDRGSASDTLETLSEVFPLICNGWGNSLSISDGEASDAVKVRSLPVAALPGDQGEAGRKTGVSIRRSAQPRARSSGLRYYDIDRDYQPGLQRGQGRAEPGEPLIVELPAALDAANALALAEAVGRRSTRSQETAIYRIAELDQQFAPGALVSVPGQSGIWRVDQWEWQADGVALQLVRLPLQAKAPLTATDAGRANTPPDLAAVPSVLAAFELPWNGEGSADATSAWAAVSASGSGWTGAALFAQKAGGALLPLGGTGRRRAVIGKTLNALPSASPLLIDRASVLEIELVALDLLLTEANFAQLCAGANRALVGNEVLQFASAVPLGQARWRLSGFLRGRGGTEHEASCHQPGETFVLLDERLIALDPMVLGDSSAASVVASGLGDVSPAVSPVTGAGITRRPLSPVHAKLLQENDGRAVLSWVRRARGAWLWLEEVDAPLNEPVELWEVQLRDESGTLRVWQSDTSTLQFSAQEWGAVPLSAYLEIRQIGKFARSHPLTMPVSSIS